MYNTCQHPSSYSIALNAFSVWRPFWRLSGQPTGHRIFPDDIKITLPHFYEIFQRTTHLHYPRQNLITVFHPILFHDAFQRTNQFCRQNNSRWETRGHSTAATGDGTISTIITQRRARISRFSITQPRLISISHHKPSTLLCKHVVPRPTSGLETCFHGSCLEPEDNMTFNVLSQNRTKSE